MNSIVILFPLKGSNISIHTQLDEEFQPGVNARSHFMDFEFVANGDLRNFLDVKKPILTENLLLSWANNLSSALKHLHDGVHLIHFDLKLQNILVAEDFSLKIADMGTARNPWSVPDNCPFTRYYTAPEQLDRSLFLLGYKVDIFSLGVLLYEITNARHPFWEPVRFQTMSEQEINQSLISNVRNYNISNFNAIFRLNREFIVLIQEMIQFDPSCRPTAGTILNSRIIDQASSIPARVAFGQQVHQNQRTVLEAQDA